jgi:hypothetical protein
MSIVKCKEYLTLNQLHNKDLRKLHQLLENQFNHLNKNRKRLNTLDNLISQHNLDKQH